MKLADLAVKHDYYCTLGNYYSNECSHSCDTVEEFIDNMGDSDMDMNLLFRWDVKEHDPSDYEGEENAPEGYYAEMFFILQRKGIFMSYEIKTITEDDVEAFLEFVEPRHKNLMSLWAPFGK